MEEVKKRTSNALSITMEFLGGTSIDKACEEMYHLHMETGARILAKFNGVRISMDDFETHKRIYGDRET